ncbi:TlyA family rRNA (cytidine-2'-O)-methyltransferase [Halarcobacter mediterraneus]|uniref:TlyA family rRNA (Cytidine-2'-O)-methyltransferase n=1 Tax=Halarcobacter mediterraneus TaxID=2023153 RepID=A0A4Q1AUJ0_9BACT|nr:TlyA family RNA methyltransferase [Halarcobacter mediterraneus]RXK12220.1 TlyA family rRNA (cytidine-2'-O)-methyltransferase [Halarcobacter mediterraneus]
MRLDLYLTKHFNIQSRNKASELIKSKKVKVDGIIISKASYIVEEKMNIELLEDDFYVSRAAYKLKYFLEEFNINIENKIALDIGSSTGGFTQILLENNIKEVTCVDVGSNQLHKRIKEDKRIIFFENQDIRTFKSSKIFDLITCDVSFISILNIIEEINNLANKEIIILFKPQFEVGNNIKRDKKGVVKDKNAILKARQKFLDTCKLLNWELLAYAKSKLEGKDGNEEELFYFSK